MILPNKLSYLFLLNFHLLLIQQNKNQVFLKNNFKHTPSPERTYAQTSSFFAVPMLFQKSTHTTGGVQPDIVYR